MFERTEAATDPSEPSERAPEFAEELAKGQGSGPIAPRPVPRVVSSCPRCGVDMAADEGERSRWRGAHLPFDLDLHCHTCRLNFFACEAQPPE